MKEFWNMTQLAFAVVGGWLGWFLGGCDGLLYALIASRFFSVGFIFLPSYPRNICLPWLYFERQSLRKRQKLWIKK